MRILHLNSEKTWRGGEQQLAYLLTSFNQKKSHHLFVMGKKGSALESWCNEQDINFIPVTFKGSLDLKTSYLISRFCKKNKIDIMHAHTSHAHASALYSKLMSNKAKLILHRRVSFPIKSNLISHFKYTSPLLNRVICISKNVQEVLTKKTNQLNKTSIVYDSIDPERFNDTTTYQKKFRERYKLDDSKYIITNTAALSSEKDYYTFINTAEQCIKDGLDATFLIVGDGKEKDHLREYLKNKNLGSRVKMLGFINDINDILNHTDIFLVTSKVEGLGSSILDAFCKKIPVVATSAGGIPEIVIHNKTGMLAPIGDYQSLAGYIQYLLKHPEIQSEIIANALELLNSQFLITQMATDTEMVYQEVMID